MEFDLKPISLKYWINSTKVCPLPEHSALVPWICLLERRWWWPWIRPHPSSWSCKCASPSEETLRDQVFWRKHPESHLVNFKTTLDLTFQVLVNFKTTLDFTFQVPLLVHFKQLWILLFNRKLRYVPILLFSYSWYWYFFEFN